MKRTFSVMLAAIAAASVGIQLAAQAPSQGQPATRPAAPQGAAPATAGSPAAASGVTPPPGYVIGADDVLSIVFWREKDLSGDVVVRPDGRVSIPLLNEVVAAGLTPEQLREKVQTDAARYVQDPNVTVVVKQINSRKVFITGLIAHPGAYTLTDHMTVLQLFAMAGGIQDYADKDNIIVVRAEKRPDGTPQSFKVNYSQLMKRVNLLQNIDLKPGDTVIVP